MPLFFRPQRANKCSRGQSPAPRKTYLREVVFVFSSKQAYTSRRPIPSCMLSEHCKYIHFLALAATESSTDGIRDPACDHSTCDERNNLGCARSQREPRGQPERRSHACAQQPNPGTPQLSKVSTMHEGPQRFANIRQGNERAELVWYAYASPQILHNPLFSDCPGRGSRYQ
jgi:hypothetical protein